nr:unnamed protein product [Callosobruchus analis]
MLCRVCMEDYKP